MAGPAPWILPAYRLSPSWRRALRGVLVPALLAVTAHAGRAEARCTLGWYVLQGKPILDDAAALRPRHAPDAGSVHGRVVSLVGNAVSIAGICPQTPARVVHKRNGTRIHATWSECPGISSAVKLRALVDARDCATMRGLVQAKKRKPRRQRFVARRSLGDPRDCTEDDTFAVIQNRIFGPKGCRVGSCHGAFEAGGLDLRRGAAYLQLVERPATAAGARNERRVVPGDPGASFLYRKLAGDLEPDEGAPMPAGGAPPLDALELELVRAWIAAGAPPAGRVPEAPCLPHPVYEPTNPLPPPPGGYQILFEGPVLQPGEEVEGCLWIAAPNPRTFTVGRWEYSINPGSHHFAVWDHERGPVPPLGVFTPGDIACFGGGAPTDGRTISGAPESPYFVHAFPAGVGDTIEANQILGLNPHYFNEFDVPIQVKGWINLHPVQGPFRHEAETLFSGPAPFAGRTVYSIFVAPFATGTLRLRMANDLGRPMRIVQLSSHQHMRGTRFTAWNSAGEKLLENYDWAHPAIVDFDVPYTLAPGDHIDFECAWDNGVGRPVRRCGDSAVDAGCVPGEPLPVRFGLTAQDEMCYLTGFYYVD